MRLKTISTVTYVSLLISAFIVAMIPIVVAQVNYDLTVNHAYCQTHDVNVQITFWMFGTLVNGVYQGGTQYTTAQTLTLQSSGTYQIAIPVVITHDTHVCRAKTMWVQSPQVLDIELIGSGLAGSTPVVVYEIHQANGAPQNVAANPHYGRAGPRADLWRELVIESPDDQLIGIQTGQIDMLPDLIRPADIETLDAGGYTITDSAGFHMGHIGFNLRLPVLDDVNFRHALFHGYAQDDIVASIYEYTVTPVQSLVAPAQGGWVNPDVPKHPFNPGDPLASTEYPADHSLCGILRYGGYTYHGSGYGDLGAYWTDSEDNPLPTMVLWTPTYETAPTSAEHGARIVDEWHRCGLNNIDHSPADFNTYTTDVFTHHDFDMYMIFWSLTRFPDHLYDMTHSSQDIPDGYNPVGIHDPELDALTEVLKFGLDHDEKLDAAYAAQVRLYNESNPWAFPYMQLYSRVLINAYVPELGGIINSPGYGSDPFENFPWTQMLAYWPVGGVRPGTSQNIVIHCLGLWADSLNPGYASTVYERTIVDAVFDSLIRVNPYTHEDVPWMATSWDPVGPINVTVTLDSEDRFRGFSAGTDVDIIDGMKVTFNLRKDLFWQDGNPYTANDAEWSLEFTRNNQIPRYLSSWDQIIDVQVIDDYTFNVYANVTSQFMFYDWSDLTAMFPQQVWGFLDGAALATILGYEVWLNTTDTGPWPTPSCLFGTGPFVFDNYDPTGMVANLHRYEAHHVQTEDVGTMVVEMFHRIGDTNSDGEMNFLDLTAMSLSYGYFSGEPQYNPLADVNEDGIVDATDVTLLSFYWGVPREYP